MKIGIVVAMQKELALMLPLLECMESKTIDEFEFYTGQIGQHEIILMQCGIGKVNAALSTFILIKNFEPTLIINSGVAGGVDRSVRPLDVVIATGVSYHDVWCGPGTSYGAAPGMESILIPSEQVLSECKKILKTRCYKFGLICSGDKFISTVEEVKKIKSDFPQAIACDMESGAIAQVCCRMGVAFMIIRVISDTPGAEENISQYENFWADAPKETFDVIKDLLEKIK